MIISHKEIVKREENVVDDVVCNCCGNSLIHKKTSDGHITCKEYIRIEKLFGYYAEVFEDGERHTVHICEECYAKWIATFKHSPKQIR